MLKDILAEVSKHIEKAEGNHAVFNDARYTPVAFSEGNFHDINEECGTAIFIDGGNAELIGTPTMSLQLVRNAAVVMKENKVVSSRKRDFYVLAVVEDNKVKATIYDQNKRTTFAASDKVLTVCERVRKVSEIILAAETVKTAKTGGIVVLDGTLEAHTLFEQNHYEALYKEAEQRGVIIVALAKTTSITTDKGSSFPTLLHQRRQGAWYYHPVVSISSPFHTAEMFFSKLHPKSSYVFRTEIYAKQIGNIPRIAGILKRNSRELTFPGYPYGLIIADKLGRISEREAKILKTQVLSATKGLEKELASVNAHEVLDNM